MIKQTEVLNVACEVHTGSKFNELILVTLQTQGSLIDMLFTNDGYLLPPGEQDDTVREINRFFNKYFKPSTFNNHPCFTALISI